MVIPEPDGAAAPEDEGRTDLGVVTDWSSDADDDAVEAKEPPLPLLLDLFFPLFSFLDVEKPKNFMAVLGSHVSCERVDQEEGERKAGMVAELRKSRRPGENYKGHRRREGGELRGSFAREKRTYWFARTYLPSDIFASALKASFIRLHETFLPI